MLGFIVLSEFSLLLSQCSAYFSEDLERIVKRFSCDPSCTFNHSELTSSTIYDFPRCSEICGILCINSNTDLSESQLNELLKPMQTLYGGIIIENSQLSTLNSTFTIENCLGEFNFFYGFFIRNNAKLTDISLLTQFYLWGDLEYNECDFRIENNSMLNVKALYNIYNESNSQNWLDIKSSGNLKDFGCRGEDITSSSLENYRNCENLLGGLKVINIEDTDDLFSLSKVEKIIGRIDIQNTDLSNLSSLEKLKWIHINNAGLEEKVTINIQNNPEMTRLRLPHFNNMDFVYSWSGNRLANLENLHPEFCLTVGEMTKFLHLKITFVNIHAKYCKETGEPSGYKLCTFDTMSDLDDNCNYIFGDLLIETGDEDYVYKLNLVDIIFGSLIIQNTKLENLNFLQPLRSIASLDDSQPIIQILSNKNLKSAYLPSIEHMITKGPQRILIENNHPEIFNSSSSHLLFPPIYPRSMDVIGDYKPPPF